MMQAAGATALAPALASAATRQWPIVESSDTPKLCLGIPMGGEGADAAMKRTKQIGVNYVLGGGPAIPWTEEDIRSRVERHKAAGLTLYNLMIGGFNDAIYAKPNRDEAIDKVKQSIRAAGKAGLPSSSTTGTRTARWRAITRRPAGPARG